MEALGAILPRLPGHITRREDVSMAVAERVVHLIDQHHRPPIGVLKVICGHRIEGIAEEARVAEHADTRDAVADAGRAADSLTYSAAFVVCAGRDDAEVGRRAAAIGREVDELRSASPLVGTPTEIVDKLGPFAEAGVQRAYLQLLDMSDLDHLELFASEVIPALD